MRRVFWFPFLEFRQKWASNWESRKSSTSESLFACRAPKNRVFSSFRRIKLHSLVLLLFLFSPPPSHALTSPSHPARKKGCKKIAEHNPEEENPQHTFFFLFALHHYSGTGGRFSTRTRFPADVFHTFSRNQLAGNSNPDYRRVVSDRAVQRKLRRPPVDEKRSEQNVEPSSSSSRTLSS